jgi:hypothetical protein
VRSAAPIWTGWTAIGPSRAPRAAFGLELLDRGRQHRIRHGRGGGCLLLDDVHQFVTEESPAGWGAWLEPPRWEGDVVANRDGKGVQRGRGSCRLVVGVDPNPREVETEPCPELRLRP